ncbi:MAG: hypothetical protein ABEK01_03605 [Candidatus Nanohaloarchaea archaeon]
MDLYNLITKIPYALMLLSGVALTVNVYGGGLVALSENVQAQSMEAYRSAVVLENTISVDAATGAENTVKNSYYYDHRRGLIPAEFFTNRKDSTGEIGYKKRNGHCYIERVAGLDGENFGFYIKKLDELSEHATNPRKLDCNRRPEGVALRDVVFAPAMIIRKGKNYNRRLPVRIYVYPIK